MGELEDQAAAALALRLRLARARQSQQAAPAAPAQQAAPSRPQQEIIGTVPAVNGQVVRYPDGTMSFLSDNFITSDQAQIDQIMQGVPVETVMQTATDTNLLDRVGNRARANEIVRGVPFVGAYADEAVGLVSPARRDEMRAMTDAMQRQRPGETMALNVGGGVLGSIPLALAAGPTLVANAAQTIGGRAIQGLVGGAVAGATEGAVTGYGEGRDPGDRASRAAFGGAVGGGLGAVLGAAGPYVAQAGANLFRRMGGDDIGVVRQQLGNVSPEAAVLVRNALRAGDPQEAAAALTRAGPSAMLADAGVAARGLLDAAAQTGGPASAVVNRAVRERTDDAATRISTVLDDVLGVPEGANEITSRIARATGPKRNAAYEGFYATPIDYASPQGQAIEQVLQRVPQSDVRRAVDAMRREGMENAQRLFSVADDGSVTMTRMPDARELDYISRYVQSKAFDRNALDTDRIADRRLLEDLRGAIENAVPSYRQALAAGADNIQQREAAELGQMLLARNVTREEVAMGLRNITPAAREAMRNGVRSSIDDAMASVQRTLGNPDTVTMEATVPLRQLSSRANQTKLQMLLGPQEAARLIDEIDSAATAFELRAATAMNSATAIRQATQGQARDMLNGSVVRALAAGEPLNATRRFTQALTGETVEARMIREQNLFAEIATALTEIRGPRAQSALGIMNRAIQGNQPLTEARARLIAEVLVNAYGGTQRAAATLTDGRSQQ